MTDIEAVTLRLYALIGNQSPERILTVVHEGLPIPWARARTRDMGEGEAPRFFTPKRSRQAAKNLGWSFVKALNHGPGFSDTVALLAIFYRPDRRRLDVDNLLKLVMDAATNAKIWRDDSQVVAQAALLDLDRVRPRTVVAICPYLSAHSRAPLLLDTSLETERT